MLHITDLQVTSSTTLEVTFTDSLTTQLTSSNVLIIASSDLIENPTVLEVSVQGKLLLLTCQPLTPLSDYTFQAISTSQSFSTIHGEKISEDGITNVFSFVAPVQIDNVVKTSLLNYFKDNVYNTDDQSGLIAKHIGALSTIFSKALYDIRQLKNENYLSVPVLDEVKIRGEGPFDRLNEEASYEILRVAKTKTQSNVSTTLPFTIFPSSPITLQQASYQETLVGSTNSTLGTFQINDLVLNLSQYPVTKINSIVFHFATTNPTFVYDLSHYGYQLLDSKYDQEQASSYVLLTSNQAKLSSSVLQDPLFSLQNLINVVVEYQYKDEGVFVDESSVYVNSVFLSERESVEPLLNIIQLNHFPIVSESNKSIQTSGLIFSNSNQPGILHPAFLYELPFRLNGLPQMPGQYSVDYAHGILYVYGASIQDGSGPTPPIVSYFYQYSYTNNIDYIYDAELLDLVSLPDGSLRDNKASVSFSFEKVFVPGKDYVANVHKENLEERINNNLVSTNCLKVSQTPVTNVFRIYNETSGEIYTPTRWNENRVYFRSNQAPTVLQTTFEKTSFYQVSHELLSVHAELTNTLTTRVFVLYLSNQSISSAFEDFVGTSFNSSVSFTSSLFQRELWFESTQTIQLLEEGMYAIDYVNGVVYVGVSDTQDNDLETVSYKTTTIHPIFPHIIAVDNLYYKASIQSTSALLDYQSFEDNKIVPQTLHSAAQLYYNDVAGSSYQVSSSKVGAFVNAIFLTELPQEIRSVRNVFEFLDVKNNSSPLSFPGLLEDNGIAISSIQNLFSSTVQYDGTYFVLLPLSLFYLSSNITFTYSVTRQNDNVNLSNTGSTVVLGNSVRINLSNMHTPVVGDIVSIQYEFTINNLSRVVLDLDIGDLYVDYTYLQDEIIVSYEYGENQLDFRKSNVLKAGEEYFVNYKVGGLRDTLLANFGSLINISELTNFTTDLNRERYRDALSAALSSFLVGPTVASLKNIGQKISHIEPELTESMFEGWALGSSLLSPQEVEASGEFEMLPAKYGFGPHITNQTISLPTSSNLNPNEGTFETWIVPDWSGLSSQATLSFSVKRNSTNLNPLFIFLGEKEVHPNSSTFDITEENAFGIPKKTKDGVFIYYTDRWYVDISDGYTVPGTIPYQITIVSDSIVYDLEKNNVDIATTTGEKKIVLKTVNNTISTGISFTSSKRHYIFDVGDPKANRLSLFKDSKGYLVFSILDDQGKQYSLSANVSSWKASEKYYVSISWKMNTGKDELHLFVNGKEVDKLSSYQSATLLSGQVFRSINKEQIIYVSGNDIVGSYDLVTTSGSNIVTSSINFSAFSISPGDLLFILADGFNPSGYSISSVAGQTLTLSTSLPITFGSSKFSVNKVSIPVNTEVTLTKPIVSIAPVYQTNSLDTVTNSSIVHSVAFTNDTLSGDLIKISGIVYTVKEISLPYLILDNELPTTGTFAYSLYGQEKELHGTKAVHPDYEISKVNNENFITLLNGVNTNDIVFLKSTGLSYQTIKNNYFIWGTKENQIASSSTPVNLENTFVTKIILPTTSIGLVNSTFGSGVFTSSNLSMYSPITSDTGRTLLVSIAGLNLDLTTPTTVSFVGTNSSGAVSETVSFSNFDSKPTINKYKTISSIIVVMKPVNSAKNAGTVSIKEKNAVTVPESSVKSVIRYSYSIGSGYSLQYVSSTQVTDANFTFSQLDVNNVLQIGSPGGVAGYYKITNVSADLHTVTINPSLSSFSNGIYKILRITDTSGIQNGQITFEQDGYPGTPYYLTPGMYEVEYPAYLSIHCNPENKIFFGSSVDSNDFLNGILDQPRIYGKMFSDTRIGETTSFDSITKHYNSIKQVPAGATTYVLLNFNEFPFTNVASFYSYPDEYKHFVLKESVNSLFGSSLQITSPIELENNGIVDSEKEGTIEFWASPENDTYNDSREQTFFEASAAINETLLSSTSTMIELPNSVSKIIAVMIDQVHYEGGATIEFSRENTIQEITTSTDTTSFFVSQNVLQVISVTIANDLSETEYAKNAVIGVNPRQVFLNKVLPHATQSLRVVYKTIAPSNKSFIHLKKNLPYENTTVTVVYLPVNINGDSISIKKDRFGYLNFTILANQQENVIRVPIFWKTDSWHRVKASYKINQGMFKDEMRLFVDGYHYTNSLAGFGIAGSFPEVSGTAIPGDGYFVKRSISYHDPIHRVLIGGSDTNHFFGRMDNVRISDHSRELFTPYKEPIDLNYFTPEPVTKDLYTTYLLDVNDQGEKVTNFATLFDKDTGSFDFTMTILDSLDIIKDSTRVKQILEKLISVLKPAQSKVLVKYKK